MNDKKCNSNFKIKTIAAVSKFWESKLQFGHTTGTKNAINSRCKVTDFKTGMGMVSTILDILHPVAIPSRDLAFEYIPYTGKAKFGKRYNDLIDQVHNGVCIINQYSLSSIYIGKEI